MKKKFDFRRYYLAIKKNKIIMIVIILISIGIGVFLNLKSKPNEYKACASVYSDEFGILNQSSDGKYIYRDYKDIVESRKIADRAEMMLGDKGVDGLYIKAVTTCSNSKDSPVYYIYATTDDPELSIEIANAVAKAFVVEMNSITEGENAKVLDEAYEYNKVFDGILEQKKNIIIISLIGVASAFIIVLLIAILSNKIETVNDVTLNGEIEVLGVIPNFDVE